MYVHVLIDTLTHSATHCSDALICYKNAIQILHVKQAQPSEQHIAITPSVFAYVHVVRIHCTCMYSMHVLTHVCTCIH